MVTKVYGISGYTTTCLRIPAGDGKAWIEVEFTRGCPNSGAYARPATYVTSDKTVQSIIEHSPYFGRMIRLVRVSSDEGNAAAPAAAKPAAAKLAAVTSAEPAATSVEKETPKVYPDVKTYEEAISVLKSLGAKATQLRSVEAAKKFMSQNSISFPNYNFD